MVAMVSPRFTRSLVSTIHAVSLCRRLGLLSCLSTWPHELADMAGTRPQVVTMSLNTVPPVDCKCAAAAAGPSSRYREVIVLSGEAASWQRWLFRGHPSSVDIARPWTQ